MPVIFPAEYIGHMHLNYGNITNLYCISNGNRSMCISPGIDNNSIEHVPPFENPVNQIPLLV